MNDQLTLYLNQEKKDDYGCIGECYLCAHHYIIYFMSNIVPKTRHGGRNKRFSSSNRKVDENKRKAVIEEKLRFLEEDFYEDPNKMA